jgi:hypothetical protein
MLAAFRVFVIVGALVNIVLFPIALDPVRRPQRAWLLVIIVEMLWFSAAVSIGYQLHAPTLRWYRTPLIGVADVLGLIYCLTALSDARGSRWKS